MSLVRIKNSPFNGVWDVKLLVQELEEKLDIQVIDISIRRQRFQQLYELTLVLFVVNIPSNLVRDSTDMEACLARVDANMPDFDGFSIRYSSISLALLSCAITASGPKACYTFRPYRPPPVRV